MLISLLSRRCTGQAHRSLGKREVVAETAYYYLISNRLHFGLKHFLVTQMSFHTHMNIPYFLSWTPPAFISNLAWWTRRFSLNQQFIWGPPLFKKGSLFVFLGSRVYLPLNLKFIIKQINVWKAFLQFPLLYPAFNRENTVNHFFQRWCVNEMS